VIKLNNLTRSKQHHQAHVEVEDTGGGLTSEAAAGMFEPFYSTKTEGMGMGLSIARSIVLANGGNIWATNNSDGGATFHFTVPLASAS
jgi:signal transduction histidine kinase